MIHYDDLFKNDTNDEILDKLDNKEWRMNNLYQIKTKNKELITFKRNLAQTNYAGQKGLRNLLLKARQLGFSTECLIDLLDDTINTPNTNSAIVAHERDKVVKLFEIVKRAYENMPDGIRPRVSFDNRNELYFPDLDSKIFVTLDTRSETVHNLHWSEVAFTPDAENKAAAIFASVPSTGKITMETTANGMGGYFYDEWEDGVSLFRKHFYNWMWESGYADDTDKTMEELQLEYMPLAIRYGLIMDIQERFDLTKEQFNFYINQTKRNKHLVVQEYPTTAIEAFIAAGRNVFHQIDLQKHAVTFPIDRKWGDLLIWEKPLKNFKYVIGIDPAEGLGGDFSVIEVFNAHTGEQAAEYASNYIRPADLGTTAMEIGNMYNKALIVIESNNHGHAVIDSIRHKYYNLYRREAIDKLTREKTYHIGFSTNGRSKPLLVDNLEDVVRNETIKIRSADLIKEMKVFVQTDESGKQGYGAEGSAHDDRVMATGLAVQGMRDIPVQKKPETLAEARLKDYIKQHGLPTDFKSDSEDNNYRVTGRDRPISRIRKGRSSIYGSDFAPTYNNIDTDN